MARIIFLLAGFASTVVFSNAIANENPFSQFTGNWVLKDQRWEQSWDGKTTEVVTIENHRTNCTEINTPNSLLCVVSAPSLKGHILWAFDPVTNLVHHLSSFGEQRNGIGVGSVDQLGNLFLKISFPSEGEGTYREYRYTWVSGNEYSLYSRQYLDGQPTGNFYAGAFTRATVGAEQ